MISDVKRTRYQFDLAALQRLAAVNYACLQPLVKTAHRVGAWVVKISPQLSFVLSVLEQAPYTTEIRIQQQATAATARLPRWSEVQLDVRLYHDAQLAEVIRSQGVERIQARYEQPNAAMHQRNEKHQINQFLQEWLQLLRQQAVVPQPLPGAR
ncbi:MULTISPECIES: DUF1249 domain-containing protein [Idiomarinaceae]|uniref:DUF1249 domain-containing protein n=2 Tax=Pseudidiomarina TaxID=2800384 RepID=A0AB39X6Z1_9GAMM|nr:MULTISPECIES: DUF1249 domain-containing protein [Idiomarinaceae]MDT7526257.1 DUF1249 domain-containing protein [Pseudidiomarina sp. GXY010]MRJ43070.1 DUF1249 domain-containing protein [Idiomarina sp. FeN1]NCU58253.1 DUF1249 domain-containing protein [Idiomarina sp. FenA--70]NCU60951.1 DUF1249 domain-containing protein [Idiomarina sp. FenBw--71]UUN14020.1 DUF1249 domain-containing protein [Idiomarina loihiensis]